MYKVVLLRSKHGIIPDAHSDKEYCLHSIVQGFPKRRQFLKIKNIPDLLSDDKKGKING